MKKIFALLIALLLCVTAFAACSGSGSTDSSQQSSAGEVTIEETTILDEQGIVAVAKSFGKYEGEWLVSDHALVIDITNNTEKAISLGLRNLSVNGCMLYDGFSVNVEPGQTGTLPVDLEEATLENYGISTVADFEFNIAVEDGETYETLFESDPISIKTSAYEGFEYKYDESGTVMYDADGVKIIAKDGLVEHDFFGQYVNLYVINQSDKSIYVSVAEGSVNGKAANITLGSDTPAGKRSVNILSVEEEDRPENIESLTLSFSIIDNDTGDFIVEKTDPVTLTF